MRLARFCLGLGVVLCLVVLATQGWKGELLGADALEIGLLALAALFAVAWFRL